GLRIGFPIELDESARKLCLKIVGLNNQCAIKCSVRFQIHAEHAVIDRKLPERRNIARVQFDGPFKVPDGLFPAPLTSANVTSQLEYLGFVGQGLPRTVQLSQRTAVIQVSAIKIFRVNKMCFARAWTEANCRVGGRFRQRETRSTMI